MESFLSSRLHAGEEQPLKMILSGFIPLKLSVLEEAIAASHLKDCL